MATITKNRKAVAGKFDANKAHTLLEAANVVKSITTTKFDASVDIAVRLGVDPKKIQPNGSWNCFPSSRNR